jgi:hypothetical protein
MHHKIAYAGLAVAILAVSNSVAIAKETDHHLAARAELADEAAAIQKDFGDKVDVSLDGYDHELVARGVGEDVDYSLEGYDELDEDEDDDEEEDGDGHETTDTEPAIVQRDVEDVDGGDDLGDNVDYSLEGHDHTLVARDRGVVPESEEVDYSLEGYDHELVAREATDDDEDEATNIDLKIRDAAAHDKGSLAGAIPKNIMKKLGRMKAHNVQPHKRSDDDDEDDDNEDADDTVDLEARDAAAPASILKKLNRLKPYHVKNDKRSTDSAELDARDAALPANILKKLNKIKPNHVKHQNRMAADTEEFKKRYAAEEGGDADTDFDLSLEGYDHAAVARDKGEKEDNEYDFESQDEPQGYDHSKLETESVVEEDEDDRADLVTRTVGDEAEQVDEEKSWLNVKRWFQ